MFAVCSPSMVIRFPFFNYPGVISFLKCIIQNVHNDGIDSSSSSSSSGTRLIKIKCNEVTSVKRCQTRRAQSSSENERKKHPGGVLAV